MAKSRHRRSPQRGDRKRECSCVFCSKESGWECLRRRHCRTSVCGALRVRDAEHNWRIMYRIDSDAVLVLDVYSKKTRKIPDEVIGRCQQRLKRYDAAVKAAKKQIGN